MIIPSTYFGVMCLLVFSMLCWGSWANTLKMGGKWRFELYYFDWTIGVALGAVLACFTFGYLGDDVNFLDNLAIVRKMQMAIAMAAGAVFNLANMLLVAAITVAGMSIAFPLGMGLAFVIGVTWSYLIKPQGNVALLFGGLALVIAAIVVTALAHRIVQASKPAPPPMTGARGRVGAAPPPTATTGIVLSLLSGLLMGMFLPLIQIARKDEIEMAGYPVMLLFALGVLGSTPFFSLYFLNLPVQGSPVKLKRYFDGSGRNHLLGLLGGMIWCAGAVAAFVAPYAADSVKAGPVLSHALGQGGTLLGALCGLLVWKEFDAAPEEASKKIRIAVVLYLAGVVFIACAPLFT